MFKVGKAIEAESRLMVVGSWRKSDGEGLFKGFRVSFQSDKHLGTR